MSDVIDNSKVSSIEKHDNRIRVSNYDLTRYGNERFLAYVRKTQSFPKLQGLPKLITFGLTFQERILMILNLIIAHSQNVISKRPCLMIAGYTIAASTSATLQLAPSISVPLTKIGL